MDVITMYSNNEGDKDVTHIIETLQRLDVQQHFRRNFPDYGKILKKLLIDIGDKAEIINLIRNENVFHKQFLESDEFSTFFFDDLMDEFLDKLKKFDDDLKFFDIISRCIQKWVFNKNIKSFVCYLTGHPQPNCSDKHSICKQLIKFLSNNYCKDNSTICYKLIFNAFTNSFNNNSDCIYRILIVLVEILGFNVKEQFEMKIPKTKVLSPSLPKSLDILLEIFEILTKAKLENEFKINDISLHDFIKNLLQSILITCNQPNENCYNIIIKIIELDPLIVESLINEIIIYAMIGDNREIQNKYCEFLIKIIEVFAKLHRIQNFISKLIPVLKINLGNRNLGSIIYTFRAEDMELVEFSKEFLTVELILPVPVLNYFTDCITNLASWQVINLVKTMMFHFREIVADLPMDDETPKLIYLETLSTLMGWLLSSVRMAENTVPSNVIGKFIGSLEELKNILKDFGTSLLHREHNHILLRSFLSICYNWAEIYIILDYYSISNEVNLKKTYNNDYAPCNIVYLHDYLTKEQWCLISERVTNFGENPCKLLMQKLIAQKLRAMVIFDDLNDDVTTPIIKELSINFDPNLSEILRDKFIINNFLHKMPSSTITNLCDNILDDLLKNNSELVYQAYLFDNQLIINGLLNNIFLKINKILKQKRKLEEDKPKVASMTKIFKQLPNDLFFDDTILTTILMEIEGLFDDSENTLDIKIHGGKILKYLEILRTLPINFCTEDIRKVVLILLLALHQDILRSNCDRDVRNDCELLVTGIIQGSKFNILELINAQTLVKIVVTNFIKSSDLYYHLADKIFRNSDSINNFQSGIVYLKENLKDNNCLKCIIITLNIMAKVKRSKLSNNVKSICLQYKTTICKKLTKFIFKKSPEFDLVEPYATLLKIYLTQEEKDDDYQQIKLRLNDYIEFVLNNLNNEILKSTLILFTTVLNNKSSLELEDNLCLKIWNSLRTVTCNSDFEEYSHLIVLIVVLIPNEEFSNILIDLLDFTGRSIDDLNYEQFFKYIKTWQSILSCNINVTKMKILHEQLEKLLQKLILTIKSTGYQRELYDEIAQFYISIIQRTQLPLTSDIIDSLLVFITALITTKVENLQDFVDIFKLCGNVMHHLFKSRNALMMDRLPPYLIQYRLLLKELSSKSNADLKLDTDDIGKLADCAHQLEKLTKNMVAMSANDIARISPYLISDILVKYESVPIYTEVKRHLNNCLYSLLSLCDQHSVAFLMRVLSDASNEIFRHLFENYKKSRFTGKV